MNELWAPPPLQAQDTAVLGRLYRLAKDRPARYLERFAQECLRQPPAEWRGVIELLEK